MKGLENRRRKNGYQNTVDCSGYHAIAMGIVVMMIRNKQLELRYALSWFVLGVGILILDCFPDLITELSEIMGIGTPINMLFFFGFCFSLMVIFVSDCCCIKTYSESKETCTRNCTKWKIKVK